MWSKLCHPETPALGEFIEQKQNRKAARECSSLRGMPEKIALLLLTTCHYRKMGACAVRGDLHTRLQAPPESAVMAESRLRNPFRATDLIPLGFSVLVWGDLGINGALSA